MSTFGIGLFLTNDRPVGAGGVPDDNGAPTQPAARVLTFRGPATATTEGATVVPNQGPSGADITMVFDVPAGPA